MSLTDKLGKLKQSGKRAALAGILGSSLLYNPGCTPLAIVGGAALIAQSNRDAAEIQAQGNNNSINNPDSTRINNVIKARDGVRNIFNTPWGRIDVICSNYVEDFDRNHSIDYPNDFMGIKEKFKINERISLIVWGDKPFNGVDYKLLNQNGEIVESWSKANNINIAGALYNMSESEFKKMHPDGKLPPGMIDKLDEGNYRAVWHSENNLVATFDFQVYK